MDPATGSIHDIATFDGQEKGLGVVGRGWLDRQFVLIRSTRLYGDRASDVEILVTNGSGGARVVARITEVFTPTIQLHASRRMLYMTRREKGTHNIYALSLETGALTAVTQNAMPGVTFSGLQPTASHGVIGVREERREDIWLIQQTATPRSGSPAGR